MSLYLILGISNDIIVILTLIGDNLIDNWGITQINHVPEV
ncbi:hypothetical protein N39L_46560 [Limnospira platensis NIES-39]|uniref:Uncharacterized protein n=1 Tax=Limnospira platensis NIES-46 TaxID=1236695 RepID=A0A5M3TD55_LIMPL|nr:hypothetical protein N39L_46560 [Arthrospira platensis NIES-39]GCE96507.1 hypothetical protein NIES46_45790 [Arthrospira platensis NIES-46]